MVNLRKGMLGAKGQGPMSEVPLVVNDYESGFSTHPETGNVTRYPDIRVHPDDPRAEGQTTLALRTKKQEAGQYSNGVAMAESQMKSIAEAAGPEGTTPLLNKDGEQVGTTYAVTADLMYASGKGNGLVPNTKTLKASDPEYGVQPTADGKTINNRIFEAQTAAKEAKEAAAAEAEAPEPEAEAPAKKAPAKKAAAKKAPAKKAAAKRPSKAAQAAAASVEPPAEAAAEAESDQPSV